MSLTTEQVTKNAQTFFKTGEKYGFTNEKLIELIGDKLIKAPATMTDEGYNSFDGGLIAHIIDLTGHALKINDSLPEDKRVNKESLIKVCFLHQIGKFDMFVKQDSDWHIKRGLNYKFNDATPAMTVANCTVSALSEAKLFESLEQNEREAIMLIPTDIGHRKLNHECERIAGLVKSATIIAILQEK